ncbi:MAG TPA: extracellular solute-binding protein [Solirubrobacteraceae bacterium]|nr:extracellular solute-binding protein [Solirubrobacteraceae bacterium]
MRRKLATASWLIALVLALVVAACGGDDNDDKGASKPSTNAGALKKGTTVNFWIMPNGPQPKADMEKTVKPFEQQTGVKVNVEVVGWDVQLDRIKNAAVSGQGPDVTQAGTTQVPFFAALGGFEDLSSRISEIGGKSAYAPGVWQTTQLQGQDGTYAVPWFTEARAIYYRKDVLEKAGIDPATAFTDTNAFQQTLQTIKEKVPTIGGKPISPFGMPGKKAFDLVHHVMPFVWDNGGAELSDDASKSTINSAEAEKGVDFVAQLVKQGLFDKSMLERDGTQVENQFKGGRLAVWIGGPWVLSTINSTDDKNWVKAARENVGVAAMPTGPAGKAFTFVGGSNLMMYKSSQNKNEDWALMKYLSGDSVQKSYAELLSFFPARLAPQEQVGNSDDNHKAFYSAIKQGRTYAPIAQWGAIENAYKGRFGNILDSAAGQGKPFNEGEVKSELNAAAKEADALLAQGS